MTRRRRKAKRISRRIERSASVRIGSTKFRIEKRDGKIWLLTHTRSRVEVREEPSSFGG